MISKKISVKKMYGSNSATKGAASLSIVYADTGKRIRISPAIMKYLGDPKNVSFGQNEDGTGLYLQATDEEGFSISKGGTIYNSAFIQALVEDFKLDFSNQTSHTFPVKFGKDPETNALYVEIILNEKLLLINEGGDSI